jgi:hypothetical protein
VWPHSTFIGRQVLILFPSGAVLLFWLMFVLTNVSQYLFKVLHLLSCVWTIYYLNFSFFFLMTPFLIHTTRSRLIRAHVVLVCFLFNYFFKTTNNDYCYSWHQFFHVFECGSCNCYMFTVAYKPIKIFEKSIIFYVTN